MEIDSHVNVVRKFSKLAGQSHPNEISLPTEAERKLRAKLILEEAFETIEGLGVLVDYNGRPINASLLECTPSKEFSMKEVADGACDLFWVGVAGVAALCGFKLSSVLEEVDRSNMSKFIDGYRREDGKWQKGKSYSPADIESNLVNIGEINE